jgi:hypothetical protein
MIDINFQEKKLDEMLTNSLSEFGFKRRGLFKYKKKVGECEEKISLAKTKVRGEEKFHIYVIISANYKCINEVLETITGRKRPGFSTIAFNMDYFVNGDKVYGFYIDVNTDITAVAEDVTCKVREYAIPELAAIDTIDKYYELLKIKDPRTIYGSTFRHEWSLLALTILKDKKRVREVFEIYEDKLKRNKSAFEYAHVRFENNNFEEDTQWEKN